MLDLGSGSGRDCYAAAALVGENGRVTGIDMTAEQLTTARKYRESFCTDLGYQKCNLDFVEGYIEKLADAGIQPNSYDLVISNCVVNLSPDKRSVLREVYNALKEGGEFYFSDVYCDRRLPKHVQVPSSLSLQTEKTTLSNTATMQCVCVCVCVCMHA